MGSNGSGNQVAHFPFAGIVVKLNAKAFGVFMCIPFDYLPHAILPRALTRSQGHKEPTGSGLYQKVTVHGPEGEGRETAIWRGSPPPTPPHNVGDLSERPPAELVAYGGSEFVIVSGNVAGRGGTQRPVNGYLFPHPSAGLHFEAW